MMNKRKVCGTFRVVEGVVRCGARETCIRPSSSMASWRKQQRSRHSYRKNLPIWVLNRFYYLSKLYISSQLETWISHTRCVNGQSRMDCANNPDANQPSLNANKLLDAMLIVCGCQIAQVSRTRLHRLQCLTKHSSSNFFTALTQRFSTSLVQTSAAQRDSIKLTAQPIRITIVHVRFPVS